MDGVVDKIDDDEEVRTLLQPKCRAEEKRGALCAARVPRSEVPSHSNVTDRGSEESGAT